MYWGKHRDEVELIGRIYMNADPYWFYNLVIFFDEDNQHLLPRGMLSFYNLFVDQLDLKLYEEQVTHKLSKSHSCFFYMN